ncbi:MAG: hypothetical protein QM610_05055 [Chitinophagaceae bacterium]
MLLFVLYLLFFSCWLYRWGRKRLSDEVSRWVFLLSFLLRVGVGIGFAYYTRDLAGNDYWRIFRDSKEETDWLLHDTPKFFYKDIWDNNGYKGNPFTGFFYRNGDNGYFNDLKDNLIIKCNAVLNVFSGSNYYVNVLIANFLVMWCLLGLARVCIYGLQPQRRWTVYGVLLLYPPLVLWTSNIQKDMVSLALLAVVLYTYIFQKGKVGWQRLLYWTAFILSLLLMLLIKNYMAMILAVCLVATWLPRPGIRGFARRFLWLLVGCLWLFALCSFFPDSVNLPLMLARKQHGFYEVNGGQPIPSTPLSGDMVTYLRNLPHAVVSVFVFPMERSLLVGPIGWMGLATCVLFLLLTYCAVRFPRGGRPWQSPFFLMLSGFCLLHYLLIGETVAYYGALLRYRSVAEAIFCMLMLQLTDIEKIDRIHIVRKNI